MSLLEPRLRRNIDWILLLSVFLLMAMSLLSIRLATLDQSNSWLVVLRQGLYFGIGLGLMALFATRDYTTFGRFSPILYTINLLLLLWVLLFSPEIKGSTRWIPLPIPGMDFKLQPSEFSKIITIITLSSYVARLGTRIQRFPYLLLTLVHVIVPMVLIMKQPDLGTSLVLAAIWTAIVFLGGADWRHLALLTAAAVGLACFAWFSGDLLLKPYQRNRVETFLDPTKDPRGKGYHVLQSMKAIGSGQTTGQGLGKGIMTNLDYVPENDTDFIFTVVGEEGGFVGSVILLSVYALFFSRGLLIIASSEDPAGRLMAGGCLIVFAFHMLVNLGMTMGIMPVVGVPLPLMSFGGSATWANLMKIGLLLSIGMRRHKLQF
ncbi:MAG: rod shape-determining protein RodA [Armatimonadaceae bacterium]